MFSGMDVSFCYTQGRLYDLPNDRIGVSEDLTPELEPIDINRLEFLKKKIELHATVYCLTDNDPEGEWIASHVKELCGKSNSTFLRVRVNELTQEALRDGLETATESLDQSMISLAVTRRVVDRLIGYYDNDTKELRRGRILTPMVSHIHREKIPQKSTLVIHDDGVELIVSGIDHKVRKVREKIESTPDLKLFKDDSQGADVELHNTMSCMLERSIYHNTDPEVVFDALQQMYEAGSISYTRTENKKYEVMNGQHKGIHAININLEGEDADSADGSILSSIELRTRIHLASDMFDIKSYQPSDRMAKWCKDGGVKIESIVSISKKRRNVHEIPRKMSLIFGQLPRIDRPQFQLFRHSKKTMLLCVLNELALGTPATLHTHVRKLSELTIQDEQSVHLNTKGMRIALQTDGLSLKLGNVELIKTLDELMFNNTLSIEDKCKKCLNVLQISDPSMSEFSLDS